MYQAAEANSKPFRLNPGVRTDKGELLTECVVRVPTRSDLKEIARAKESDREDLSLALPIVRVGNVTDRTLILLAVAELATVDELRIRGEIAKLEAECMIAGEVVQPITRPPTRQTDIVSEPFALNPGPLIDNQRATSCRVRLLTRAENKILDTQAEPDDLFLLFAVIQLGNVTDIKPEHIDALTVDDAKRIGDAYTELRALHAPDIKS